MPEVRFKVRWPDGSTRLCYSPSTIILEHLVAGAPLPVADFLTQVRVGLEAASARVAERYGSPCLIALREIDEIERHARRQAQDGAVTVEFIE